VSDPAPRLLGFVPRWDAPASVRALITTRSGGVSTGAYDDGAGGGGLNLGLHCEDAVDAVVENRRRLALLLPQPPRWLQLVHGTAIVEAESVGASAPIADAATAITPGVVCCVTMADCLPVLLAERRGRAVGIAHAGWRGLAAGVIQDTVAAMRRRLKDPSAELTAFLGPAIGVARYEVGREVHDAMRQRLPHASRAFSAGATGGLRADLTELARQALAETGVHAVQHAAMCTYADAHNFYSYRRDRVTGRQAALIWLGSDAELH
jgi:purine-nucleoside/S-methyl-5'-thioadenosine phosphorylase / adenosine deaminase